MKEKYVMDDGLFTLEKKDTRIERITIKIGFECAICRY